MGPGPVHDPPERNPCHDCFSREHGIDATEQEEREHGPMTLCHDCRDERRADERALAEDCEP